MFRLSMVPKSNALSPRHYVCSWDKITSASATVHRHRTEGNHFSTGGHSGYSDREVILSRGVAVSSDTCRPWVYESTSKVRDHRTETAPFIIDIIAPLSMPSSSPVSQYIWHPRIYGTPIPHTVLAQIIRTASPQFGIIRK